MIVCPKCNKLLEDGTNFCDECGTPVDGMVFCSNCGKKTSTEFALCQSCSAPITETGSENVVPNVKKSKKLILFACIGIAAVAVVLISILIFGGTKANSNNYSLYIKDKEIFFNDFSRKDPLQLTSNLMNNDDIENYDLESYTYLLDSFTMMSNDGKIMFFPDKINSGDDGYSLYYRYLNKPTEESTKIDSDVIWYHVNDAATSVTYLKGYDSILYQYDLNKDEKEKIDSDVSTLEVSDDGNKIYYLNNEGFYLKNFDKDKEKIDSGVTSISYLSKDFKTIVYLKEDALYKKIEGQDKVKISSDVCSVLKAFDSGKLYYLKSNSEDQSLMNYIQDDMKEIDESISYPEMPTYPSYWDYDTTAEYEAAYAVYEKEYEAYMVAYEQYSDKLERDDLREALKEEVIWQSSYTLCYYNGAEEKVISDSFVDNYSFSCASYTPVVVYNAYNQTTFDKIKLSEIQDVYDVSELVTDKLYSSFESYVAVADVTTVIEQNSATNFCVDSDGKTIYYIDDVPEDKSYGDLYKIAISDGKVQKPEMFDSDVYAYQAGYVADGQFMYFKDYKDGKGELYINKTKIDYDVNTSYVSYLENAGRIVYFTDWNSDKEYGTLKMFENGKSTKVSDDVHQFAVVPEGNILYLYDYSNNYYEGDLYVYRNSKVEKIDGEVVTIIPITDSKGIGEINNYGW